MPFVEYSGKVLPASGEKDFEKGPQGYELSSVKDMAERLGNDWWHLPATAIGAAGLGAAGKAVYDWYSAKSQPPATRIEPTLLEPAAPAAPIGPRAPSPGEQVLGTKITDPAERRLADMYAAQQQARGIAPAALGAVPPPAPVPTAPAPAAMPPAAIAPTAPAAVAPSATSVAPAATPIAPAPAAPMPTTFAGATVAEPPVAAPTAPAQAAKPPAEKTKSTFKSAADIPSGYVFRPDVGNLDRGLFNILGPEHRLYAKELLNNGMPFGNAGPKDYNQRIAQITEQYWKAVQGQTPETILSREARTAQGVPHGEFGTYGSLGRKAKVAGVAGTLLSAAEAALAAQQGRYGEAAVRGMDVATDFIPGVAAAKQALAPQGVAPGTVPGNILDAAAKLGSPYYETEWARTQRMREAAGAGRGFVNPPLVR